MARIAPSNMNIPLENDAKSLSTSCASITCSSWILELSEKIGKIISFRIFFFLYLKVVTCNKISVKYKIVN